MPKEKILESLKEKYGEGILFNCLNCKHSHSTNENELKCLKMNETVAENFVCLSFEK